MRLVNDQFVKKAIGEPPDRYCLPPDFITKNTSEEDSFMAKTTDILLSELENIDYIQSASPVLSWEINAFDEISSL